MTMSIPESMAALRAAKTGIANKIVAKGGTVNAGDGFSDFEADIDSIHIPVLQEKSVTENGTVLPDSGYDALSRVEVNVPNKPEETRTVELDMSGGNQTIIPSATGKVMTAVTIQKPATMIPENIKKDVVIGGTTGTLKTGGVTPNLAAALAKQSSPAFDLTAEDTDGLTVIGAFVLTGIPGLKRLTLADSVTTIGNNNFAGCGLISVATGNGVEKISQQAFAQNYSLNTVTLGEHVNDIGSYAFQGCSKINSITIYAIVPPIMSSNAFYLVPANCPIYVPAASVDAYKTATNWSNRAAYIQAIQE